MDYGFLLYQVFFAVFSELKLVFTTKKCQFYLGKMVAAT